MINGDIETTEKECVKDRYPHLTAKIRLVQRCAAILAIAELLCVFKIMRVFNGTHTS